MALEREIRAFDARRPELEKHYHRKFVVFHDDDFAGAFDDFDSAAREAIRLYGRGPYLIRQVGVATGYVPAGLLRS
jgi:hypothetical protein